MASWVIFQSFQGVLDDNSDNTVYAVFFERRKDSGIRKMVTHSVRRHLRVEIEAYDRTIRAFIPAYEEMLRKDRGNAVAEGRSLER